MQYRMLPDGCMSRTTFYKAVQELRDAGFLKVIFPGGFHNKKAVYELRYF